MEFPEAFWEGSVDYFGAAVPGGPAARGRCFMFWNLQRFAQKPVLTAVVAGAAAEVTIIPVAAFCSAQSATTLLWQVRLRAFSFAHISQSACPLPRAAVLSYRHHQQPHSSLNSTAESPWQLLQIFGAGVREAEYRGDDGCGNGGAQASIWGLHS